MQAAGARATSIVSGVFEAAFLDRRRYGLVGKVARVEIASIETSINVGSIPVIASLGETSDGQILNINADMAANKLVQTLEPYKIIFLTGTGGLLNEAGNVIDSINLCSDYEPLIQQPWLHSGMRLKLEQIKSLLDQLPLTSSVSITRPAELASELFTHRGSGTLVRCGEKFRRHASWKGIDTDRLRSLIESSFRRRLDADYFQNVQPWRVYLSEKYRAALILQRVEVPALFWRSRRDNPVNEFYVEQADGFLKQDTWTLFWYGIDDLDRVRACAQHCRERPASLK